MKLRPLVVMLVVIGLVFPLMLTTGNAEYTTPIVWSDKKSYDPSATAYLYGYGFNPFTPVTITIVRPDLVEDIVITSTDEFGYFSTQYLLDGLHGTFNVTATDGVNVAITTFGNHLYLKACWKSAPCCNYIYSEAGGLRTSKSYYVKYFDPAGIERRQSPTYSGVNWFEDEFAIAPSLPDIIGWWVVRLYENGLLKRTKWVCIDRMVWTTDSTFTNTITSFAQGETVYFKTIGLLSSKYHRFQFEMPNGTRFYVGDWFTGVTSKTGSFTLPGTAPIGGWKLHVRKADDFSGSNECHYVDCCFSVTEAPEPQQYYLTVQTNPLGIGAISGEGWYYECTYVNLTAPDLIPGATGIQYRFDYWDVDSVSQGAGVDEITVHMDANHTATAHYITQYYLNLTTDPLGVTTPAGIGWYDAGTSAPIFTPEFVGILPSDSRYRFDGWTTGDMSEIANSSATSTTVLMDKAKTVTANYVTQYFVTFNHTGLDATATDDVVTVDSVPKGFADLPYSMWIDENSILTYSYGSMISTSTLGKRFSLISIDGPSSPFTVTSSVTVTGNYKTQYYLTLETNPGSVTTPSGEGWYDAGAYEPISTDEFVDIVPSSSRYTFLNWTTADISEITDPASPSTTVLMDKPKTVTANYKVQYFIAFDQSGVGVDFIGTVVTIDGSDYGAGDLSIAFWWDEGSTHSFSFHSPLVVTPNAKRYVWESTTGLSTLQSDSLTITTAGSVTGNYKTQYYLTVTSPYGTTSGEDWYDSGSTAYATLDIDSLDHGNGTRRLFTSWSGDASGTDYTQSDLILMDGPKTAIASWKTQYYLTITTTSGGTTNPPSSAWYDDGTLVSVTAIADINYVFDHWELNSVNVGSANPYSVTMDTAHALHAVFVYSPPTSTYYLTVKTDPTGVTTIPGEGWYVENEDVPLTAPNYVTVSTDARYKFSHWNIDGIPQGTGINSIIVHMDANHTAIAHYVLQYYLTVRTSPLGIVTIPGEGWYDELTNVSLTAPPVASYDFLYWDVDSVSQGSGVASISVTMGSPHVATAHYRQKQAVVGGSTISIKSPLLDSWIGLNIMLAVAIFSIAFWIKKQRKETS